MADIDIYRALSRTYPVGTEMPAVMAGLQSSGLVCRSSKRSVDERICIYLSRWPIFVEHSNGARVQSEIGAKVVVEISGQASTLKSLSVGINVSEPE